MSDVGMIAAIVAACSVAKPVVKTGCELIENLLGQPTKVAGGMLADELYAWRWGNRVRIASRAKEIMDANNIAERVVPKGFLLPLVDASGDVEEPELQELWARLLASGVADNEHQHPMLIDALRRMSKEDAKRLEDIAATARKNTHRRRAIPLGMTYADIWTSSSMQFGGNRGRRQDNNAPSEMARLVSLGLMERVLVASNSPLVIGPDAGNTGMKVETGGLVISEFGWQFIRAVMPEPPANEAEKAERPNTA